MHSFYISYILIGIAVIASLKGFKDSVFLDKYMNKPFNIKHYKEYYRAFTHVFLHADPMHLIFNMLTLFFFGPPLEDFFVMTNGPIGGNILFLALFILGGLFATLIPFYRHKDHEFYRSLGASGAVAAIMFTVIMFAPTLRLSLLILPIPIPAYIFGPLYLAFEFWADRNGKSNIAHDAHIGGALFGILFALITNIEQVKSSFYSFF